MRKLAPFVLFAFALLVAPVAQAADGVPVGHSGWTWSNPQPQGSTLGDVAFAGGVGYAAGAFGTVLKTSNGGLTWQSTGALGTAADLKRVKPVDANTLIVGGGCALLRSDDGGSNFAAIPAATPARTCKRKASVAAFAFVDATTGYVVLGDGSVKRTGDGGQSYSSRGALPGTAAAGASAADKPADLALLSSETAVALAGKSIYRSTDGGSTWTSTYTAPKDLSGLTFVSTMSGYAVGAEKTVLKTNDGGVTWTPLTVPAEIAPADLTGIDCAPGHPELCLIGTHKGDQLLRTANGGTSFGSVAPSGGRKIFAAAFSTPGIAAAVGDAGAAAVSGDGGQNWTPVGSAIGSPLSRLRATASGSVLAPGEAGTLVRAQNAGADWNKLAASSDKDLVDAAFADSDVGFALDSEGDVHKTLNGGSGWSAAGGVKHAGAIFAPDAKTVLLLGPGGLSRSVDGGAFEQVGGEESANPALTDYDRAGTGLVLYGPRALEAADSSGGSLKPIARPGDRKARIRKADFLGPKRGFVLNRDGRLWLTRDGGKKWSEIRTTGTSRAYDMAWGDASNGYLSVDRLGARRAGYVLHTDDGGHTWRPQLVAATPLRAGGLVATAKRTLVALAGIDQLLYTTTGGDHGEPSTMTITPSATRTARGKRIKITGRIAPAVGGADAYVSVRGLHGGSWHTYVAKPTSGGGRFTVKFRLMQSSVVVAHWLGDATNAGDGSNVVAIRETH